MKIDLSKGLLIENQNILIPWGIANEEAWKIGNPLPWNLAHDRTRIKWENVIALGGLQCTAQTHFKGPAAKLDEINLLQDTGVQNQPDEWHQILEKHCNKYFGEPVHYETWRIHKNIEIRIKCDDRFGTTYWLNLENTAFAR